jgi:hypothetical protein
MRYVEKHSRNEQATDDNIIRRMCLACWITMATDTHSEYVIFIALQRQQWFREGASVLRYTYIASLVNCNLTNPMFQTSDRYLLHVLSFPK